MYGILATCCTYDKLDKLSKEILVLARLGTDAGQAELSDPHTGNPCCSYDRLDKLSRVILKQARHGTDGKLDKLSRVILVLARLAALMTS